MKKLTIVTALLFISFIGFSQVKKDSGTVHKTQPIKTDSMVVVTFKLSEFNSFMNFIRGLDLKPSELQPAVKFIYDRAKLSTK